MAKTIDIEHLLYWAFREQKVETNRNANENALTVYWAVMALPSPFDDLIRHQARIGRPPNWEFVPEGKVVHLVSVRYWRERYGQWHKALNLLQHTIDGALHGVTVAGPAAPSEPWRSARAPISYSAKRA